MNNRPALSILMTAYNAADYIDAAIRSILGQSFTDYEFIIVNDGSTDNTEKIIGSYSDPRIILLKQKNKGIAAALNYGLSHAQSDWIVRFDADDICYPHRLQVQYDFITRHPDHIIVGSAADYIDMYGNFIFTYLPPAQTTDAIYALKYKLCPFIHSSVLFKKEVVLNAGGYDLQTHGFEDHFLWLKILDHGKAGNIPQSLLQVRLNPQSFTIDERWRPKKFRALKSKVLLTESISPYEGAQLANLLQEQNFNLVKEASYHALLGKKYLWNNYQPQLARENLSRSWQLQPKLSVALLWLFSFMPSGFIALLYRLIKSGPLRSHQNPIAR
jgi:glycosyltransferase involved in cell wall biosynthesis